MYKISKEQMQALDGSIEKWDQICNQNGIDNGRNDCSLCQIDNTNRRCEQCIIYLDTGGRFCEKSPYEAWVDHHTQFHSNYMITRVRKSCECPECYILANEEYEYLKDLKTRCVVAWWKTYTNPIMAFIYNIIYI